jgi:hypothetical protein
MSSISDHYGSVGGEVLEQLPDRPGGVLRRRRAGPSERAADQ